jgi:uncharacterized protein
MSSSFLDAAKQGKNGWARYLGGTLLSLFVPGIIVYIIGFALLVIASIINPKAREILEKLAESAPRDASLRERHQHSQNRMDAAFQIHVHGFPIIYFFFWLAFSAFFLIALVFVVERIHKRRFQTLLGRDRDRLSIKRIAQSFVFWLGLTAIGLGIRYAYFPSFYRISFNPSEWFLALPFSFLLTGAFALSGCFFINSYLLQAIGLVIPKPLYLVLFYGVFFGLLGMLPFEPTLIDSLTSGLIAAVISAFMAWLVLKDDRVELLIGFLMARSLFSQVVVQTNNAKVITPTILKSITQSDVNFTMISFLILCSQIIVFYLVFFYLMPRRSRLNS